MNKIWNNSGRIKIAKYKQIRAKKNTERIRTVALASTLNVQLKWKHSSRVIYSESSVVVSVYSCFAHMSVCVWHDVGHWYYMVCVLCTVHCGIIWLIGTACLCKQLYRLTNIVDFFIYEIRWQFFYLTLVS